MALHALSADGAPVMKTHPRAAKAMCIRKSWRAYKAGELLLEPADRAGGILEFDVAERALPSFLKKRLKAKAN